jgi:galactitol-specific phosphotransferase system IIB component
MKYNDIIIIGSGMSGLYSGLKIKNFSPNTSFLILEKYKKNWIGGRTSNETFYGTEIVTGAGIGRKDTNPLLIKLMKKLNIHYSEFKSIMDYSKMMTPVDIIVIINKLKSEYKKHPELHNKTFKNFFIHILGLKLYKEFLLTAGYTDFENADLYETLYNYGMDDNKGGWTVLHVPWKKIVDKLYEKIGKEHFRFSSDVIQINKVRENPCLFEIKTENNKIYYSNKVIIATTITGIKNLVPGALNKNSLYQQIHSQPFLRLYAKFDHKSSEIMRRYVPNYTIVPGPLQKIIPIDANKGVYMIAYSDNNNAIILKNNLKDTPENRELYSELIEESIGIPEGSLTIISIKDFYWPIGTHYYEPLKGKFKDRNEFVYKAQHPQEGIIVVGEVVSRYQGWCEGALESVETVVTNKWVKQQC